MFPKYYGSSPNPSSASSSSSQPLFWSCLNTSSAAAELLQLARKSKERAEQMQSQEASQEVLVKPPSSPAVSPLPTQRNCLSPVASPALSSYKPFLKFSVNAILARDSSPEEDRKPLISRSSPSPPQCFSPNKSNHSSQNVATSRPTSPVNPFLTN